MTMTHLQKGDAAPDFELDSTLGRRVSLHEFQGKGRVILFFYPKAGTSVCTAEACAFRDHEAKFEAMGVTVLGISTDGVDALQKFRADNHLNYPLLSDAQHRAVEAYGVAGEIKGTTVARRVTFVIGKDGRIEEVQGLWDLVTPLGDAAQVKAHTDHVVGQVATLAKPPA